SRHNMRVAGQGSQGACLNLPRPENATRSNCAILQWLKVLPPRFDGNHTHAASTHSQQNPSPQARSKAPGARLSGGGDGGIQTRLRATVRLARGGIAGETD